MAGEPSCSAGVAAQSADNQTSNPAAQSELGAQIKRQIRDAFYIDTEAWKSRIVEQGMQVAQQALAGLAG